MKNKVIAAFSVLALMSAVPAFAEGTEVKAGAQATGESTVAEDLKEGLTNADNAMREAADEVRAYLVGDEMIAVTADMSTTARGMIGETIVNPSGDSVAKVDDIIIDSSGTAQKIIVADGGLLGIGAKKAAFDYGRVISQDKDGKVVMQLSEDMINSAKDFAYEGRTADRKEIMKDGHVSISQVLDGHVFDDGGDSVADIDNVTFEDGKATHVIATFDKVLGLGGKAAALDFDTLQWAQADGEANVTLSASQSAEFKKFRSALKG